MTELPFTQSIALIGGTGRSGPGLARHLAASGVELIIGSRERDRADASALAIAARVGPAARVRGALNGDAAAECDIALITVPFDAVAETLPPLSDALAGKVVISTVVPLEFEGGVARYHAVEQGSAAQLIARLLAQSMVTAALHTVSSRDLDKLDSIDADVLITGDDDDAVSTSIAVVRQIPGARPVLAGKLENARHCEGLTVLILGINRRYKVNAGIRIAHLP